MASSSEAIRAEAMPGPVVRPSLGEAAPDQGWELKRGAIGNAIAVLVSNFRSIFTFLVARLLGPAVLGTYMVAWAATDVISRLGVLAFDVAITTFIARAEATADHARSRALFRIAVGLVVLQCAAVAILAIITVRLVGARFGLEPQMVAALSVMLCALPGLALYKMSTAVSRGMKVMRHDIFSRGLTDSFATTIAFLAAFYLGWRTFAPEIALIVGSAASGVVAFLLAASLFRNAPPADPPLVVGAEIRKLFAFAAPISAYDLLNSAISRLDVILLALFIGRAPGVTLPVIGIYGIVVEVAIGLRKVNQAFNPIFGPIVAGLTVHGEQTRAAAAFARLTQWMLWILLPLLAAMLLAGSLILWIYGPQFREGAGWLGIVAIACAVNALVGMAETVIMVQRPHLNLINSAVTGVIALVADLWLISRFGVTGAAFGILLPYLLLGVLRWRTLRKVFGWKNPWSEAGAPLLAGAIAGVPAVICRLTIPGVPGQVISVFVFGVVFFFAWRRHRARSGELPLSG
ncbi:MAG: oligosaccharide flippase family protein [Chthoniobacterales bacterium]